MRQFKIIGITSPKILDVERESADIVRMLNYGAVDYMHLRKPDAPLHVLTSLVKSIPEEFHHRLTLHSHFSLINDFNISGVHLNSRWPHLPKSLPKRKIRLSTSAHTLDEVKKFAALNCYTYVTLSPIYDSISKPGYNSKFSPKSPDLKELLNDIYLDVIALGGVTPDVFDELYDAGFAGVAILGYLWSSKLSICDRLKLLMDNKPHVED